MSNILTEEIIEDQDKLDSFILEEAKRSLPDTLQKHLSKKSNREKMLEKYGEKAFLLPKELKFPVINPFTDDYDCRLIYAAYVRSKQHDYKEVEKKAEKLYDENECESKIDLELQDGTQLQCHELFDLFLVENTEYRKFFKEKLKKYGVKAPDDLDEEKRKKFFDEVDREWKAQNESVEEKSYQTFFREKLDKYGVDSPDELNTDKREKFFDEVDREWKADNEKE